MAGTRFFVPAATDAAQAERVREAVIMFTKQTTGWDCSNRRIFRIKYRHEGKNYFAQVGERCPRVGELVVMILDSKTYLVCTQHRGVAGGQPVIVGKDEVYEIEDFEF